MMDASRRVAECKTAVSQSIAEASTIFTDAISDLADHYQDKVASLQEKASALETELRDALKRLHTAELETQRWKEDVVLFKADLKEAEVTISHQLENITKLRRDNSHLQDQARNWQEHFLRVEQERCSLTSKLDEKTLRLEEFLLQSAARPTRHLGPLTPVSRYAEESSTHSSDLDDGKVNLPLSHSDLEAPPKSSTVSLARKEKIHSHQSAQKVPGSTSRRRVAQPDPPSVEPLVVPGISKVIRRVEAVIRVKREEESEDEGPAEEASQTVIQRRRNAVPMQDELDEDLDYYEDSDEEDDELNLSSRPTHTPANKRTSVGRPKTPPASKRRKVGSTSAPVTVNRQKAKKRA